MTELTRNPKALGALIRRTRKKSGLTQSNLGDRAGLRQETISLVETGNPATRIDTILNILAVLDLEISIGPRTKGTQIELENIF